MSVDWFRWWHGSVTDPKFGSVCVKAKRSLPEVIAVWVALLESASQADDRGNVADCQADEIAWTLRMDVDAVSAILDAMASRGLIVDGRIGAWEKRQPAREDAKEVGSKPVAQRVREHRERNKSAKVTPCNADVTPCNADVTPCNADVTPQRREEEEEETTPLPPVTDSQPKTESASPVGSAGLADFSKFWLAYPKKVGKGDAERKWRAMKPPVADVLSAVDRQKQCGQWKKDGGQFIPNPATWLHQRRWEDDPSVHPPANGKETSAYTKPEWMHGAI